MIDKKDSENLSITFSSYANYADENKDNSIFRKRVRRYKKVH